MFMDLFFFLSFHVTLGHTKLIPWSSDFIFENKERASEIFIFVQFPPPPPQSYGASECFLCVFSLQSKSLEVRAIYIYFFTYIDKC